MTRQLKTSRVFVPGGMYSRDRFFPLIRISGKWLEELGFRESAPLYVTETTDGLLISPRPPAGAVLSPLQQIKQEFKALGIETETRLKSKHQAPTPSQPDLLTKVERIPIDPPEMSAIQLLSEMLPDEIPPDQRRFFKLTRAMRKEYQDY
jgi:hypothetical protein